MAKIRLLLVSNSTNPGEGYLEWPRTYLKDFLDKTGAKRILFIPYAGVALNDEGLEQSFNAYEERVNGVFQEMGYEIYSVHRERDPVQAVRDALAIAVGGGNTFHLVQMMYQTKIMKVIREMVLDGMPYMGWSAGANVACPTMKTTNDMPISEPESFNTLNLIPFQINPHYLDAHPEGHGGETREQRIEEFLVINNAVTVVGLREASLLYIEDDQIQLLGKNPMRLFRFGQNPRDFNPGEDISFLIK